MADELLRDRIVCGVRDSALRKRLLGKKGLNLPVCIDIYRASEVTARQVKEMEGEGDSVHAVEKTPRREHAKKSPGYKVRRPAAVSRVAVTVVWFMPRAENNTARRMGESVASVTV